MEKKCGRQCHNKSLRKACILAMKITIPTKYVSCRVSCTLAIEITEETTEMARVEHGTH